MYVVQTSVTIEVLTEVKYIKRLFEGSCALEWSKCTSECVYSVAQYLIMYNIDCGLKRRLDSCKPDCIGMLPENNIPHATFFSLHSTPLSTPTVILCAFVHFFFKFRVGDIFHNRSE